MKVLSFLQPWLYAIYVLGKDVENRRWVCPHWMIGRPFLIHASAGFDREGYDWLIDEGYDIPPEADFSRDSEVTALLRSAIIGGAVVTGSSEFQAGPDIFGKEQNPWAFGPHVWTLNDLYLLDPPLRGVKAALGFWDAPSSVTLGLEHRGRVPVNKEAFA